MSEKRFCEYCGNPLDRHVESDPDDALPLFMTQRQFAQLVGVAETTVSHWVHNVPGFPVVPKGKSRKAIEVKPALAWFRSGRARRAA